MNSRVSQRSQYGFTLIELLVIIARTPGCADTTNYKQAPRPPFTPFDGEPAATHYPPRHSGGMNALRYDGHVKWARPSKLRVADFRLPGSPPPVPGYPGE